MAKGDHIYGSIWFNGNLFTHHGIDCGDGYVIEYDGKKKTNFNGQIIRKPLTSFLNGRAYQIQEYGICDSPDIVVARAYNRLGEERYSLGFNNCEHFAHWCKTGKYKSEQVKNAAGAVGTGAYTLGATGATKVATNVATKAALNAVNPVSKVLIKTGLKQAPKIGGRAALGIAGVGGLVSGLATDFIVDKLYEDEEHLKIEEREARKAARVASQVATTVGGIGGTTAAIAIGGSAAVASAVAAPVVLGLGAAFIAHQVFKK